MNVVQSGAKPLQIGGWLLGSLALLVFLVQAWWLLEGNPKPGWYSDSVFYLALADFYTGHFGGAVHAFGTEFYGISRYPPLFPLTLALGGGGLSNWTAAYCTVLTLGFLAIISTFFWLRQQTGHVFTAAALLPLAVLSPEYFFLHLEILSESHFILLVTLVLCLATICEQRRSSLYLLAAVASLVPLSRTAGVTLLMALTVRIALRGSSWSRRQQTVAILTMWIPAIAWILYRRRYPVVLDYVADLSSSLSGNGGTFPANVVHELSHLISGFAAWFDIAGSSAAHGVAVLILVCAGIGWCIRIRRLQVDALFVMLYIGLVAIWPYPHETARLLSVSMPVIALCAWQGLAYLSALLAPSRLLPAAGALASAALLVVSLAASVPRWLDITDRAFAHVDPELAASIRAMPYYLAPRDRAPYSAEVTTRFAAITESLHEVVSTHECVWTPFFMTTAFMSSFKVRLDLTPHDIKTADDARNALSACRYLLIVDLVSPQLSTEPLYPLEQVLPFARPVLLSEMSNNGQRHIAAALVDLRQ